ncbi:MAG: hypothetical protein HZA25_02355 [Candidatus Niyogibacteria bacterium]|nr:hypothetical protein [Candidatus Niyogibacteria bacterium]
MLKNLRLALSAFVIASFIFSASSTYAATLSISPEAKSLKIGEEFNFDLNLNTEGAEVNAAQATVQFPTDLLELVGVNRSGSVFNFWVEEPVISNEDGTLKFIGGTSKIVSGATLKVLTLQFKAKGAGKKDVAMSEAVVTAADGKGTNILSKTIGTNVVVSTEVVAPGAAVPVPVAEVPQAVTREAAPAKGLPIKPAIRVPLYPVPNGWYNHVGELTAFWEVPADVTDVAVSLNKNPNAEPQATEKTLVNGKNFGKLSEGVWYVHAQFKNNVGWGPVAHYKIQIDTTAPLSFKLKISETRSDNPSPRLEFRTQDALSGLAHAMIYSDGALLMESADSAATLLPLPPGKHKLTVRIADLAGNAVEDSVDVEILPLPTPEIVFITDKMSEGETIFAQGKSVASGYIDVAVTDKDGKVVYSGTTDSDKDGNWAVKAKEPLARGTYSFVVTARDNRGAVSFATEAREIKVKAKPIITIFGMELGWMELLIMLLLILVAGISYFTRFYLTEEQKRAAYRQILGEDINKFSDLFSTEVDKLKSTAGRVKWPEENVKTDVDARIGKLRELADRMRKYLGK